MDTAYVIEMLEYFGPTVDAAEVPEERFDRFEGVLPTLLLALWREVGFAGFNGGRVWLCDPVEWAPAVAAWTENLDLNLGPDAFHCVARSAFGEMHLWGERTGLSLSIEPVHGMIFPAGSKAAHMGTEFDRNIQVESIIAVREGGDLLDASGKKMFDRAVKAHGILSPDTMYSIVPAVGLGGAPSVKNLEVADAVTHVTLLAELSPHRVMGDITMSPIAMNDIG